MRTYTRANARIRTVRVCELHRRRYHFRSVCAIMIQTNLATVTFRIRHAGTTRAHMRARHNRNPALNPQSRLAFEPAPQKSCAETETTPTLLASRTAYRFDMTSLNQFTGIVKYTAVWCQPCKLVDALLANPDVRGDIEVLSVEADECLELPTSTPVTKVPTLLFLINGEEQESLRVEGASDSLIRDSIKKFSLLCERRATPNQIALPISQKALVSCRTSPRNRSAKK